MFRLNSPCISEIEYEGFNFSIDMSFDNVLDVIDVINSGTGYRSEIVYECLSLLLDGDYEEIWDLDYDFLEGLLGKIRTDLIESDITSTSEDGGPAVLLDRKGNPMPVAKSKKDEDGAPKAEYSLTHDATHIYTSFIQAYNIDLHNVFGNLHWHEFNALLRDLPNTTSFGHIVEIRGTDTSKIKDKNEKERIKKLQKLYRLPNTKKSE